MPYRHKALTSTAIADVGRGGGGGRKCIIKFALLQCNNLHQHTRYRLVAVDWHRRRAGVAHGLLVVQLGL